MNFVNQNTKVVKRRNKCGLIATLSNDMKTLIRDITK